MSEAVGSVHYDISLKMDKFNDALAVVDGKLDKLSESTDKTSKGLTKTGVVAGAAAAVITNVLSRAIDAVTSSIDSAIKRVDTMDNFPKVMSNLGISARDSSVVIKELSSDLEGLPTTLDEAALAVQRLTTKTNDVGRAKDIFVAFNNAVLAGGAPMDLQSTALEQFSQSFAKGKPDMMEWRSILVAMHAQLTQVAKSMKLASADELGAKLRDGKITMEQFSDALIKLNTKGVGGLPSLAEQAKNATSGIGTGMKVAETAITRGVASIINTIGSKNITKAIGAVGKAFELLLKTISGVIGFIKDNKDIFTAVAVAIGTATLAILAWNAALAVQGWIQAFKVLQLGAAAFLQLQNAGKLVAAAQWAINAAMTANPIGVIIVAITALVAALIYFFTQTKIGKQIMQGFFSFVGQAVNNMVKWFKGLPRAIGSAIAGVADFITRPFRNAFNFISDAWNNTVGTLSWKVPDWVPMIGGNRIGAPKLPHFENGVRNFSGGWAMVGEKGPELVNLPKGSNVFSNGESKSMGSNIHIGTINNASDEAYLMRRIDTNIRFNTRGVAPA